MNSERDTEQRAFEDDPRITAYALGELEGAEVAEVEALLAEHPAASELVDEVRELSGVLSNALEVEYADGAAPLLSPAARAAIHERANTVVAPMTTRRWMRAGRLIAASLVGLAGIGLAGAWWLQSQGADGMVLMARLEAPAASARPANKVAMRKSMTLSSESGYVDSEAWGFEPDGSLEQGLAAGSEVDLEAIEELVVTNDPELRLRFMERARVLASESPESDVFHDREIMELDAYAKEIGVDFRRVPNEERIDEEGYDTLHENDFLAATQHPVSTFSVDVDTAGYSNVRRFLRDGMLPPADAVRIEELVNYFPYDYALPKGEHPFAVDVEVGAAPWAPRHRLLRIGLRSSPLGRQDRKPSNLVFLLDVSGSMDNPDKLPLVKQSLRMLVEELDARDRVGIVVYAGAAGVVLEPTAGDYDLAILAALERLDAGGSTNGGEGIQLAYSLARDNFLAEGNNRVILATDGDFNVGLTGAGELEDLIASEARSGVFLTVLGFGTGNLKDNRVETLADKGNGHYAYIDSLNEARKVLVGEVGASLETVAKDVKIQLEFDPERVLAYRLIGYENRLLAAEDFADDTKDAGEIGAGHRVTALYEIVPAGESLAVPGWSRDIVHRDADARPGSGNAALSGLGELRLRYKQPLGTESRLLTQPLDDSLAAFGELSGDTRFAAAVASYGMLLRGSKYSGTARWRDVTAWAAGAQGGDPGGYRAEFHALTIEAQRLSAAREASGEDR